MDKKTKVKVVSAFAVAVATLVITNPALAADLFESAKSEIRDTVGEDSGVEAAILGVGAVGAAVGGFMSRNWIGAVGGFAAGMIFWEVAKGVTGLN